MARPISMVNEAVAAAIKGAEALEPLLLAAGASVQASLMRMQCFCRKLHRCAVTEGYQMEGAHEDAKPHHP